MVIVFECDGRVQWKPGRYESDLMVRYWWLWFAVARLKVTFDAFTLAQNKTWTRGG